jgi:hypothetical protein
VGDGGFENLGAGASGKGTTDGLEEEWELNQCAEVQAEQTADGSDYALRLGWSGHVYSAADRQKASSGGGGPDGDNACWAAIALPLQRSEIGVSYRVDFAAKDWAADGVTGAEIVVEGDGVELMRAMPGGGGSSTPLLDKSEFQMFSAVFTPSVRKSLFGDAI